MVGYGQTRYGLPLNWIWPFQPDGFRPRSKVNLPEKSKIHPKKVKMGRIKQSLTVAHDNPLKMPYLHKQQNRRNRQLTRAPPYQ